LEDVVDAIGVAVDSAGNVYVADAVGAAVVVYDSTATNTPARVIKGPATGMQDVSAIAVDSDGRIYVGDFDSDTVAVFSPGASGNVGPEAVLSNVAGRGVAIAP
jgi:streptogramin lyase